MKICFISKYPPIQGGVSASCYWAARGLAEKGHQVFVVTNAKEVESHYRIKLSEEDKKVDGEYEKTFPESGGSVTVYSTELESSTKMFYIPQNNPIISRLAAIATNVIQKEKCEVIFASYFEPYCVAAHLASLWTKTPYIVRHAGSDLFRLFDNEELQTTYVNVLKGANRVLSAGSSIEKLKSFGVSKNRIVSNISYSLPEEFFNPESSDVNINDFIRRNKDSDAVGEFANCFLPIEDESLPVLGTYGKIGEFKGTIDLLYSMSKLIKEGFQFYLVTMSNARFYPRFLDLVRKLELKDYIKFVPFQPNWRVRDFIRACDAVAYLERDFPIAEHTPVIPLEIISCGGCLITSEEIAFKQFFRSRINNLKNAVIIADPKDHEALAKGIKFALEDKDRAKKIGELGNIELKRKYHYDNYIARMESLLSAVSTEVPVIFDDSKVEAPGESVTTAEAIKKLFPITSLILNDSQKAVFNADPVDIASVESLAPAVVEKLSAELSSVIENSDGENNDVLKEIFHYEGKLRKWKYRRLLAEKKKIEPRLFISGETIPSLYPSIYDEFEICKYEYEVSNIFGSLNSGQEVVYEKNPLKILFQTFSPPLKLNDQTQYLLELITENSKNSVELFECFCKRLEIQDNLSNETGKEEFFKILESLYWSEVIKFSENSNKD
jgi:glycosyltransferase involved in cell wall biosynthesis